MIRQQAEQPRLLTIPETATQLGMSTRYVYDRIYGGDLPSVQLGTGRKSVRRVPADAVAKFIRDRTTGADT